MKTKHTPGPWFRDGKYIRHVDSGNVLATLNDARIAEDKANARLIAAAPEMLEVIQAYRALASSALIHDVDARIEILERMDAVVVKATGGAE